MFPSGRKLFGNESYIFQQDNDPKHTAKVNKAYLVNKKVNTFDWPSQSPDLNPIENLWSILDYRCRERVANTPTELFELLQTAWNDLPISTLQDLVASMPRRCQAVIDSKGFMTKY